LLHTPRDYHGNPRAVPKTHFDWLFVRLHLKSGSNFIGNDWQVGTITASKKGYPFAKIVPSPRQETNQKTVFTQDFY
jgi:hypothetical protein